jgi:hypothetical protein
MSERAAKPHATAGEVKRTLSKPVRPLTAAEKKQRTSFFDEAGVQATAVEPSSYARNPR